VLAQLNNIKSSIPATIRNAVRFKEEVRITVETSSQALCIRVVAELGGREVEGLEVCGCREGHEGAVVEGSGVATRAEAFDVDGPDALLIAWADDCEEPMEGVGVSEHEVLVVEDVDGFVMDLFANGEDVRDERADRGRRRGLAVLVLDVL